MAHYHSFRYPRFYTLLYIIFAFNNLKAQVVINEIQTSNLYSFRDEFYKYNDWIELYNSGSSAINLNGYGLTNDTSNRYQFHFPDQSLPAGGYVLVLSSDTEKIIINTHWETAAKANDTWKYRVNTTSPGTANWRDPAFNDASWSSGTGGIGFGDSDDGTTVATCASVYMRKIINIPDTSKILDAIFNMDYDDGFVAYLNGVEIARANIGTPGNFPAWNQVSPAAWEAVLYQNEYPDSFHLDKSFLRSLLHNGNNVLAVETHNQAATNTDLTSNPFLTFSVMDGSSFFGAPPAWFHAASVNYYHAKFKLSHNGSTIYLTNNLGTIIDQKATGIVETDNSIARNPDGSNTWCLLQTPTPGSSNNNASCATGYATQPIFSLMPGFYPTTKTLALTTSFPGGVIRYSKDGSDVTSTSTLYSAPLSITSTQTIKARVFASNVLPGETITHTYFINFDCRLPVYCLTTDPKNLNDYNTGIFVDGPDAQAANPHWGANYWKEMEKPVTVEFYERDKSLTFQFNSALAITGGWSRADPQKSLEIKLGDKFGLANLNYNLIPFKPWLDKWDDFILGAMGQDKSKCRMRNALMNRLLQPTHCDFIGEEPCLLMINGQSWGLYYTRENDDHHWIITNYGYKADEIDLLKESYFYPGMEVKKGNDSAFFAMYDYATATSPSDPSYYSTISSLMDLENMSDYFIAETYYPNNDWMGGSNNNLKLWRPKKPDGRFRYLVYDLDFGFGLSGSASDNVLSTALNASPHNYNSDLFAKFTQNPTFKNYFINRYADLINTIFLPSNVQDMTYLIRDSIRHDIHYQNEKWGGPDSTVWKSNIAGMMTFAGQRPAYARNNIQSDFGMTGQVTLTLQVSPAGAGRVQISTISPSSYPWNGVYFNGNPVTITAIPNPGYTFDHWHSNSVISTNNINQSVTYNYTTSDVITCYFTGSPSTANIKFSEINYNSDSAANAGDWVEVKNVGSSPVDISNWKFRDAADNHTFTFPLTTVIPANGYLVVASDLVKFHSIFPAVNNVVGSIGFDLSNSSEEIRLFNADNVLHASMTYADYLPWPEQADGQGYTLERNSFSQTADDPNNWFAGCLLGSPGRAYTPPVVNLTTQSPLTQCAGTTATLNAGGTAGSTYQWKLNNNNLPGEIQPDLTATQSGVYRVLVTTNGCTAVSDSILLNFLPVEQVLSTVPSGRCDSGSVILSATGTSALNWFDVASGGNSLFTGNTFNTPSISMTTTYFVEASGFCPGNRLPVVATVVSAWTQPVVQDASRCGDGQVTLSASSATTVYWYDDVTAGNLIDSGATFTTPVLSQNTIYYAQAGNTCPSSRSAATAIINSQTPDPVSSDDSRCGAGTITLTTNSATVNWYDAPGGNLLFTGNNFTTPSLNQTTMYFLQDGIICPSAIVTVNAIINSVTPDPVVVNASSCGPGSLNLFASSLSNVYWYDAPSGNLIASGNTLTLQNLDSTIIYYAMAGDSCPSNFVPVSAVINPIPSVNLGTDTVISSGSSLLLDAGNGFSNYLWSTQEITQTISLNAAGIYFVTVTDANGCNANDSIEVYVSTGISSFTNSGISFFPNPANGKCNLILPLSSSVWNIKITDATGKILMDREMRSGMNEIDLQNYSAGIYYLAIRSRDSVKSLKLFVK